MITPSHIMKTIKDTPVLQQKNIEKSFVGFVVKWDVQFRDFLKTNKDTVSLYTTDFGHVYPQICFSVKLSQYPELKLIKRDEKIIVQGEIIKVSGHEIGLSKCKLEFFEDPIESKNVKGNDIKKETTTAVHSNYKLEPSKKSWQDNVFLYFFVGLGIALTTTLIIKICSYVYNFYL